MSKTKKRIHAGELVPFQSANLTLTPESGVIGEFLRDTENMFRARQMRMKALFSRINETGQRMEGLLRMAAERMDAAEGRLQDEFRSEGLLPEEHENDQFADQD